MKVTDVKIHVGSVPLTEPETWRFGRLWGLTTAVIEVETDEVSRALEKPSEARTFAW